MLVGAIWVVVFWWQVDNGTGCFGEPVSLPKLALKGTHRTRKDLF